jgi:hypothetical protein
MPWESGRKYGSFKKILIPIDELPDEADRLRSEILNLKQEYQLNSISPASVCYRFALLFLKARLGRLAFLKTGQPLPEETDEIGFLDAVRFFGMPDTVRLALYHWRKGIWNIELVNYHPSGKEMLFAQSQGRRITTIDWEACLTGSFVEEKRDAFEHLLHDLAHAYMFFRPDYDFSGQVDFFRSMYNELPLYEKALRDDLVFRKKFEYCISDMNSHPAHLQAYFRAIKREAGLLENPVP